MILSILALMATAGVAYMGTVHGVHRSAQTLVACVLAGVIAFGLFGPATALFPANDPKSVWHYAADAFCLWGIFCIAFLGLRTLGEKLLPVQPNFSDLVDHIGGAALGAVTGYLTVGVCVVLVQMLPTCPELLGYEAFQYVPAKRADKPGESAPDAVEPTASPLWLRWDRGTLEFFNYLSVHLLGSPEAGLFSRYGDVYRPKERRGDDYEGVVNADDFLYYHWYRRWDFIRWQTGAARGPIPEAAKAAQEGPGMALVSGQSGTQGGLSVQIGRVERLAAIEPFPQERPGSGEEFLLLTVRFRPTGSLPRIVESSQFVLLGPSGEQFKNPLVYGRVKAASPENQILPDSSPPAAMTPRSPRFNITAGQPQGFYLAAGASFRFSDSQQRESRTFVYVVPKRDATPLLRLTVLPGPFLPAAAAAPAAAPKAPAAGPAQPVRPATGAPAAKPSPAGPAAPAKSPEAKP